MVDVVGQFDFVAAVSDRRSVERLNEREMERYICSLFTRSSDHPITRSPDLPIIGT